MKMTLTKWLVATVVVTVIGFALKTAIPAIWGLTVATVAWHGAFVVVQSLVVSHALRCLTDTEASKRGRIPILAASAVCALLGIGCAAQLLFLVARFFPQLPLFELAGPLVIALLAGVFCVRSLVLSAFRMDPGSSSIEAPKT